LRIRSRFTAADTATITSFDGAAAVTANLSDESSDAVSIGISIARNTIQDSVTASVTDAGQINAPDAPITIQATQSSDIDATSLAASLSIAAGGENGLSVAGGGSLADNLIGTDTTATLSGTNVGTSGDAVGMLSVEATDTSTIDADVAAVSGTVTIGGEDGNAVSIGASLAHNRIGDGTDTGTGEVEASITDSPIYSGQINVEATSNQDITANVAAASVALSGGGEESLAVSGAGAFALNEIALDISATITGNNTSADDINSGGVAVAAADTSTIDATVLAGSVAGGFGGESGTAVAIGVSFARNSITDPVTASISDVPTFLTNGGAVSVTAQEGGTIDATAAAVAISAAVGGEGSVAVSGGGALAANFVDADTQAFVSDTSLGETGNLTGAVIVTATDNSAISATIAAIAASVTVGGESGIGVAIGVSLAYNEIGNATGFSNGTVSAYISDGSVDSNGDVTVAATSDGTVTALTVAVAAALSGGGETGVGVAGAGVGVFNTISVDVSAYIDGDNASSVPTYTVAAGGSVTVTAADTALITSTAGAAAVSLSLAGEGAVSVAIGMSIAANVIDDPVTAYIQGVTKLTTGNSGVNLAPTTYRVNPGQTQIQTVAAGQTVQLGNVTGTGAYSTVDYVDGAGTTTTTVDPGEVVSGGTALYRYVGSAAQTFDLSGATDNTYRAPIAEFQRHQHLDADLPVSSAQLCGRQRRGRPKRAAGPDCSKRRNSLSVRRFDSAKIRSYGCA
jgi:hypothetical protein